MSERRERRWERACARAVELCQRVAESRTEPAGAGMVLVLARELADLYDVIDGLQADLTRARTGRPPSEE